jgi:hypothetical protein
MARQIPAVEPTVFSAGDTVSWNKSLTDYSPDEGWILSYAFRGEKGDGRLDVTAANVDGTHAISITPAQTGLMRPGLWVWAAYATLGADRYKIAQGSVRVEPNLAVTNFATDLRSPAKIAYDNAMEAWQKVKLGQTVILNGRTYTQHNLKSLIEFVDRCKSDYALEQAYADINVGGDPRHVFVRLKRE